MAASTLWRLIRPNCADTIQPLICAWHWFQSIMLYTRDELFRERRLAFSVAHLSFTGNLVIIIWMVLVKSLVLHLLCNLFWSIRIFRRHGRDIDRCESFHRLARFIDDISLVSSMPRGHISSSEGLSASNVNGRFVGIFRVWSEQSCHLSTNQIPPRANNDPTPIACLAQFPPSWAISNAILV